MIFLGHRVWSSYVIPNYFPKEASQVTQLPDRDEVIILLHPKPHLGQKITPDCPVPVSDDEISHRVIHVSSGRGIAVPQHQVKSGRVPSLQDGTHIEHGFNRQHDCRPFIRRCVVLVLEEGHPDSELSLPVHTDVQGTENRKTTRMETSGFDQ